MKSYLFAIIVLLVGLTACEEEPKEFIPDVSAIEVELKWRNFAQDLFELDTLNIDTALVQLEEKYPVFAPLYFQRVMQANRMGIPLGEWVKGFRNHPGVSQLYDTCMVVHQDMSEYKEGFVQALKYYKYYFPNSETPDITTFISEYGYGAFIYGENSLATGLDFFLGRDYPYANMNPNNPAFSNYLTLSFAPEYLVSKTMMALVDDICGNEEGTRMIDLMIHNGKKLYLLDKFMPYTADSILLEIPQEKVEWLNANEKNMWAYLVSEDLLYSTDMRKINKYVNPSPNSPGMPEEAPGRTANWLGWQIVKKYMKRHPDKTIEDLLQYADAQKLLEASRYKPRK